MKQKRGSVMFLSVKLFPSLGSAALLLVAAGFHIVVSDAARSLFHLCFQIAETPTDADSVAHRRIVDRGNIAERISFL